MAVQRNSLKQRDKGASKTKFQREPKSKSTHLNSNFGVRSYRNYLGNNLGNFVYITTFLAGVCALSWFILCSNLYKDSSFCSAAFLTVFSRRDGHIDVNDSKGKLKDLTPHARKDDSFLWVLDKRSNLSLSEFIDQYDGKRPVLITDALKGWKANSWNKDFFVKHYGDQQVVMKAVQGTLHKAESMALPIKIFAQHSHEGMPNMWTYLQDELFIQLHPELREHLGNPVYLEEDFFQIFPKEVRPWNAMLLWGTAHSRSYLHIDPYNWTGTNAVFYGKKLWKLYPPGQDQFVYVLRNKKSEFPLNCYKYNSPIDAYNPDLKKYPKFSEARAISFEQGPGELLIIPPGWFHQAFNAVETIAVSSQVMNSQNYHIVLEEILKAGNIDRKTLPSDFYQLAPVDQVKYVSNALPSEVLQRGRDVTNEILQQMGYPTK